jgi:hypothetical protein
MARKRKLLNNLLENREMCVSCLTRVRARRTDPEWQCRNLEDGTHILHPHRHALLPPDVAENDATFVPAHPRFRVIAIAAPVPPNTGHPLDPPFRSRFQARFVEPAGAMLALERDSEQQQDGAGAAAREVSELETKLRALILSTQYASASTHALDSVAPSALPAFPQTALAKLSALLHAFPPPPPVSPLSPAQLARLLLTLHPRLLYAPFTAWAMLSERTEHAGLGPLGSALSLDELPAEQIGLLGYVATRIERADERTARITFTSAWGASVTHAAPAGAAPLAPFPPAADTFEPGFRTSPRFAGLLTGLLQAHVVRADASYVPPPTAGAASCSTGTLVRAFARALGYAVEAVHAWKEMGGRELVMRRVVREDGGTAWEPRCVRAVVVVECVPG